LSFELKIEDFDTGAHELLASGTIEVVIADGSGMRDNSIP
jgi:hypothetical protein